MRLYRILLQLFSLPVLVGPLFDRETGRAYGVGFWRKLGLACRMIRNNLAIASASSFIEHLLMAATLLNVPKEVEGVVVECGTYKGVSAANLSLACALVGRRLAIFDSFQGLPEPDARDQVHTLLAVREKHSYASGAWCGTLEEVRANIRRFGRLEVCDFHPGFFHESLPAFRTPCVLAWVDVDLRSSLEPCVRYLWPLLADGGVFYTHEAMHTEIASLFYSQSWWRQNLACDPPGLVGAGTGLGLKILSGPYFTSSLGFTVKNPATADFHLLPQKGGMKLGLQAVWALAQPPRGKHETVPPARSGFISHPEARRAEGSLRDPSGEKRSPQDDRTYETASSEPARGRPR